MVGANENDVTRVIWVDHPKHEALAFESGYEPWWEVHNSQYLGAQEILHIISMGELSGRA